jgi:hypothetical protein
LYPGRERPSTGGRNDQNPGYKLFLGRPTEAWYQLSEEEQADLMDKVIGLVEQAGGKTVSVCDSGWSSEQWLGFGVEEFPDIEAVQKHTEGLDELDWFRYIETMTFLGSKMEES